MPIIIINLSLDKNVLSLIWFWMFDMGVITSHSFKSASCSMTLHFQDGVNLFDD